MQCTIAAVAALNALGLLLGNLENGTPSPFVASCVFWWIAVGSLVSWLFVQGWRTHFLAIAFSLFFAFAYPTSGLVLMGIPGSGNRLRPIDVPALTLSLLVGGLGWGLFV